MVPAFSTFNRTLGMFLFGFVILGVYLTNTWNTGYLPINSNRVWDHFGQLYNVSRAIDSRGMYDHEKYMSYSAAYLGAGNTIVYLAFFGVYTCAVTHVFLFHRYEIFMGFKNLWRSIRRKKTVEGEDSGEYKDVHNRLMAVYPEGKHDVHPIKVVTDSELVSEWWYLGTLLLAMGLGFAGVAAWPTYTTPGVVPYGIFLAIIFVIPIGVIKAMTGIEVTLNVLAEFIGGIWVEGNALAMNFFKSFGYVTCAHAVHFANDLKIAHYLKVSHLSAQLTNPSTNQTQIPPRHTFAAQMLATLISTFVCTAVMNFQVNIPNVCQPNAPMRFFCPGPNTFFTAAVLWGTIGPIKVFGPQGQYGALLLGFPLGIVTPIMFYYLLKRFPKNRYLRQFHPVAIWYGGLNWTPYSFSYAWPGVPIAWLSWIYVRNRYLAFWSKVSLSSRSSFLARSSMRAWKAVSLMQIQTVQLCLVSIFFRRHRHLRHHHAVFGPMGADRGPLVGYRADCRRLRGHGVQDAPACEGRAVLPLVEPGPDSGAVMRFGFFFGFLFPFSSVASLSSAVFP
jgi:hypothetical protein